MDMVAMISRSVAVQMGLRVTVLALFAVRPIHVELRYPGLQTLVRPQKSWTTEET